MEHGSDQRGLGPNVNNKTRPDTFITCRRRTGAKLRFNQYPNAFGDFVELQKVSIRIFFFSPGPLVVSMSKTNIRAPYTLPLRPRSCNARAIELRTDSIEKPPSPKTGPKTIPLTWKCIVQGCSGFMSEDRREDFVVVMLLSWDPLSPGLCAGFDGK